MVVSTSQGCYKGSEELYMCRGEACAWNMVRTDVISHHLISNIVSYSVLLVFMTVPNLGQVIRPWDKVENETEE